MTPPRYRNSSTKIATNVSLRVIFVDVLPSFPSKGMPRASIQLQIANQDPFPFLLPPADRVTPRAATDPPVAATDPNLGGWAEADGLEQMGWLVLGRSLGIVGPYNLLELQGCEYKFFARGRQDRIHNNLEHTPRAPFYPLHSNHYVQPGRLSLRRSSPRRIVMSAVEKIVVLPWSMRIYDALAQHFSMCFRNPNERWLEYAVERHQSIPWSHS